MAEAAAIAAELESIINRMRIGENILAVHIRKLSEVHRKISNVSSSKGGAPAGRFALLVFLFSVIAQIFASALINSAFFIKRPVALAIINTVLAFFFLMSFILIWTNAKNLLEVKNSFKASWGKLSTDVQIYRNFTKVVAYLVMLVLRLLSLVFLSRHHVPIITDLSCVMCLCDFWNMARDRRLKILHTLDSEGHSEEHTASEGGHTASEGAEQTAFDATNARHSNTSSSAMDGATLIGQNAVDTSTVKYSDDTGSPQGATLSSSPTVDTTTFGQGEANSSPPNGKAEAHYVVINGS
ncbi:hypothetical protein ACH5RR_024593 [Cinchona calisaya]|uniref:Uncharacterized protein n=1 Tax=Cinchona calisaya TaxID=153742 RepID=A0ABD2YY25_9GENT